MKKNEIKIFENEELNLQVRTILNTDGSISVNAEDTALGFGWTQEKNGKTYVKWERINGYCKELGFSPEVGKDDYLPESLYYLLGMKANNERALKYQRWIAMEVLPTLRKTGFYGTPEKNKQDQPKKEKLQSVNKAVRNIERIFTRAGVEPIYIAAEAKRLYSDAGYEIKTPLITDNAMQQLWNDTRINHCRVRYQGNDIMREKEKMTIEIMNKLNQMNPDEIENIRMQLLKEMGKRGTEVKKYINVICDMAINRKCRKGKMALING